MGIESGMKTLFYASAVAFLWLCNGNDVVAQIAMRNIVHDTLTKQNLHASPTMYKAEQIVPQNYYTRHLGFFCRQELKMQQAKVPVTFRLGSMDECNRLEQKPGYR